MLKIEGSFGKGQVFRVNGLAGSGHGTDGLRAMPGREGKAALIRANN